MFAPRFEALRLTFSSVSGFIGVGTASVGEGESNARAGPVEAGKQQEEEEDGFVPSFPVPAGMVVVSRSRPLIGESDLPSGWRVKVEMCIDYM